MRITLTVLSFFIISITYSQSVILESFGPEFDSPVEIKNAGDTRLFVVEQPGRIKVLNVDGNVNSTSFLDISSSVNYGGEKGLLGLAFHPNYPTNPSFFVNYINNSGNTVISKFTVSVNPDIANTEENILMTINQPYSNHNGGCINFGKDGYLYIGMGDGGSGGDPQNYAQNLNSLLGKMLRINIDHDGAEYSIPEDNPYVGIDNTQPEIWSYGLRNPWKFSFDTYDTGGSLEIDDIWIADVGQNEFEEINLVDNYNGDDINYGWRCYEGDDVYNNGSNCPSSNDLTFPIATYSHSSSGQFKCSITGGYVYRGSVLNNMHGVYFFADYCSGEIGLLNKENDVWDYNLVTPSYNGSWVTFGKDMNDELYVASVNGGLYKIVNAALSSNEIENNNFSIYPNPFSDIINFNNTEESLDIKIYDINGKNILSIENYRQNSLDLKNLNSGVYFIKVNNQIKKIIKR